jgi:hypothetical protein|tara:strand:- start:402 stop:512 length:111 start_codon:yes stop_codon:yes gene_type:complete
MSNRFVRGKRGSPMIALIVRATLQERAGGCGRVMNF